MQQRRGLGCSNYPSDICKAAAHTGRSNKNTCKNCLYINNILASYFQVEQNAGISILIFDLNQKTNNNKD